MNTVLEINNLYKNFKRDEILTGINMSVNENRIYGLLGPNGASKSTLLKIITGVIKKDRGNVMLFGRQLMA
jgi:ABC-2 type transport system ATP-binding protein